MAFLHTLSDSWILRPTGRTEVQRPRITVPVDVSIFQTSGMDRKEDVAASIPYYKFATLLNEGLKFKSWEFPTKNGS